jgi:hypothetical protein
VRVGANAAERKFDGVALAGDHSARLLERADDRPLRRKVRIERLGRPRVKVVALDRIQVLG